MPAFVREPHQFAALLNRCKKALPEDIAQEVIHFLPEASYWQSFRQQAAGIEAPLSQIYSLWDPLIEVAIHNKPHHPAIDKALFRLLRAIRALEHGVPYEPCKPSAYAVCSQGLSEVTTPYYWLRIHLLSLRQLQPPVH